MHLDVFCSETGSTTDLVPVISNSDRKSKFDFKSQLRRGAEKLIV